MNESSGAGNDRISLLPDDILLCILRRIPSPEQTAQTTVLSSRWRSLWRSYPVVEFFHHRDDGGTIMSEGFRKFGDASILRFSQNNLLVMEKLNLRSVGQVNSPVVEQLLDLASNRKAEEISINYYGKFDYRLRLPLEWLSFSSMKSLKLSHLDLVCNNYLELEIVGAPKLETLNLCGIHRCCDLTSLSLNSLRFLHLRSLKITDETMVSELPLLKSLIIGGSHSEKKLEFSSPKLEKFELWPTPEMEEIKLDAGPDFSNFILSFTGHAGSLKKCEIRNAPATCLWELACPMKWYDLKDTSLWYLELKKFLDKFSNQFHTVNVSCRTSSVFSYDKEANQTPHPNAIRHLKIDTTNLLSYSDRNALLGNLFRTCHPRYITFVSTVSESLEKRLFHVFLSLYMEILTTRNSGKESTKRYYDWQYQLKDVKIIVRDVYKAFQQGENEEESSSSSSSIVSDGVIALFDVDKKGENEEESSSSVVSKAVIALFEDQKQVCFELTWD
ncbi:Putative FBD-associated F-box protein At5g56560 [Linum grandiflorum]